MTMRLPALLLAVAAAGCARPVERTEEVPGTYVLSREGTADTLLLRPDGRYVRWRAAARGAVARDSGAWEFEGYGGEHYLKLRGFAPLGESAFPFSQHERIGWNTYMQRTAWGTVRIVVDADLAVWYEKVR